jgi:pilus assembly protein TadC
VNLKSRIGEDALGELVFAVQKAHELGTPLGQVFRRLAEQLRRRRSQAAEKAAGRANANITFPGLIVMAACVLLIVAPFVLKAIDQSHALF